MLAHSEMVYIKKVPGKGRGVFARKDIPAGSIIERVPKVFVPVSVFVDGFNNPFLSRYCFLQSERRVAILLGFGTLYNHSFQPNADYEEGPGDTMLFRALRDIEKNEEICINYNGEPNDQTPVSFEVLE